MKKVLVGIIVMGVTVMFSTASLAQELPKAKKLENRTWHEVVMVKFEPGKMGQAMNIIHNHFEKAGKAAGTPGPQLFEMRSGEWDILLVWTMDDISEMNWEVGPDSEKWWKAMAEQEGGAEKAMKVWQNYIDMVEETTSYIATTVND